MDRDLNAHLTPEEMEELMEAAETSAGAREHAGRCEMCAERLARYRNAGRALQGIRSGPGPRGPDCPPMQAWYELAAGIEQPDSYLEHAASCAFCGAELQAALADPEQGEVPRTKFDQASERAALARRLASRRRNWTGWYLAAAAAVVAAIGGTLWIRSRSVDHLIALAYAEKRTVEFRLPGAPYGPVRVERAADGSRANNSAPLLEAEARVASELSSNPDAPDLLDQKGRIDVLNWNYTAALRSLTRASELSPNRAPILVDLAAAYFERAEAENRPADYAASAELLSRALAAEPNNTAALFNRGMVFERLMMFREAQADWERYLRLDPRGAWADEARRHLAAIRGRVEARENIRACAGLSAATAASWRDSAGLARSIESWEGQWECLRERALTVWLPASLGGDETSKAALLGTARAFREVNGDTWFDDLLRDSGAPRFAEAAGLLAEAASANLTLDSTRAASASARAGDLFHQMRNPAGEAQAAREHSYALRRFLSGVECARQIEMAEPLLRGRAWPYTAAQIGLEAGSCSALLADYGTASRQVRAVFDSTPQPAYRSLHLRALSYLESYSSLAGDAPSAWASGEEGLRVYWPGAFQHVWAYQLYYNLATAAASQHYDRLAARLQHEALAEIQRSNRPLLEAFTWFDYGRTALVAGERGPAQEALATAERLFQALPRDRALEAALAECEVFLAQIDNLDGHPAAALARLQRIEPAMSRVTALPAWLRFDRAGADAEQMLGRGPGYETRLRRLIGFAELGFASAPSPARQQQWSRDSLDVYKRMAGFLAIDRHDPRAALDFWEFARSAPLRWPGGTALEPAKFQAVLNAPALPDPPSAVELLGRAGVAQALIYAALDDRLLIWRVRGSDVAFHSVAAGRQDLERLSRRLYVLCSAPDSSAERIGEAAARLGAYLIGPVRGELADGEPLWVELDDTLDAAPLAVVPYDGAPLGEHFPLAMFGSAAVLARSEAPASLSGNEEALAVGISAGVPALPSAVEEAREVARHFSSTRVLINAEADAGDFKRNLARAVVFHFAGHSRSTADRLELLSGRDSEDAPRALLDSREVAAMDLTHCRLAVISACSGEAPELFSESRAFGFASALLRAGAAGVLTTRWDADSAASVQFMREFYARLLQGQSAARAAQGAAALIRKQPATANPYYWAAYQFFGRG